ncbi:hypothetical protein PSN45_001127 [Yamadazyma tenuis]|uniref:Uncharacterized protein n=1 Tax=Candida tenuis (strain ATCC 10573 / BCRC 21748 / CBS 615 / JCM 9827 / NBRC 10315 / NRRL Y-1498 / VKM Y-70) TaxID=590646 RepID=G3B8G1_CANTC|nr:uncharacterized protein CANTEDRAFT_115848 [Yamadazyma tenuis ATCC 10573]XP_006689058.1 uncharacterized protein CANTEDRAFT_115848 [Yamadazyma tenuis ATCC 10573]EGV62887.1 hypothetical protein CANTEDRAFT_115848 [Yamadazyma tenuis ATCC 10573]EGV62888.1 hypothetical protein CANTEDRAFT_115848 [Yamadazyma tenuis ATCC 10573]WEJ93655.1 hypothetical protein PSN45_001127 [Yamadazyma tenuis]
MSQYFLLQTENYDPLVSLVESLAARLSDNDEVIARLLKVTDSLRLPRTVGDVSTDSHPQDELRYHLDTKYKLSDIQAPDYDDVANVQIRQLLRDNYRLLKIKKQNDTVNEYIFKTLLQYQRFVTTELIPMLRLDFEHSVQQSHRDLRRVLHAKLQVDASLWAKYQEYLQFLQRLFDMFEELTQMLTQLDDERVLLVEAKLEAIRQLM